MVLGNILERLSPSKKAPCQGVPGFQSTPGANCLVTGSTGLCGARLVEMLLERGAATVVCFDIVPPSSTLKSRFEEAQKAAKGKIIVLSGQHGDLTNKEAVDRAFQAVDKIDVCYHIAALVGPFHDHDMYMKVNFEGTMNIIEACKKFKVPKLVNSSSPGTRFTGADIEGLSEDELPIPNKFMATYAETKAYAELEVTKACSDELRTVSVAPHQVYGPYDSLFMPNLLETCGNGRLRIFGKGDNKISVCYVDNYCHGLMCGADALYEDSPALGKFYIVTDEDPQYFWKIINQAGITMGFDDMEAKFHLPVSLLYAVAYVCNVLGFLMNKKFKLNPFNVRMLTMHRYFSIDNAKRDLQYVPQYEFDSAWPSTVEWFKVNWLPTFLEENTGSATSNKED